MNFLLALFILHALPDLNLVGAQDLKPNSIATLVPWSVIKDHGATRELNPHLAGFRSIRGQKSPSFRNTDRYPMVKRAVSTPSPSSPQNQTPHTGPSSSGNPGHSSLLTQDDQRGSSSNLGRLSRSNSFSKLDQQAGPSSPHTLRDSRSSSDSSTQARSAKMFAGHLPTRIAPQGVQVSTSAHTGRRQPAREQNSAQARRRTMEAAIQHEERARFRAQHAAAIYNHPGVAGGLGCLALTGCFGIGGGAAALALGTKASGALLLGAGGTSMVASSVGVSALLTSRQRAEARLEETLAAPGSQTMASN